MRREKTISELEFLDRFNTDGTVVKFFERTIWPQGRYCPTCGVTPTSRGWVSSRKPGDKLGYQAR